MVAVTVLLVKVLSTSSEDVDGDDGCDLKDNGSVDDDGGDGGEYGDEDAYNSDFGNYEKDLKNKKTPVMLVMLAMAEALNQLCYSWF